MIVGRCCDRNAVIGSMLRHFVNKKIMNSIVEGGNLNISSTIVCWMFIFEFATIICFHCHKLTSCIFAQPQFK